MNPTSWEKYRKRISAGSRIVHPKLNIFKARYAIARGFPHIVFHEVGISTSESYYVALRLSLAFTAFESLESALNAKGTVPINDAVIANRLRSESHTVLFDAILSHSQIEPNLSRLIRRFVNGEDDNLRPFAYSVRNLMFHGSFTANLLQLDKSKHRRETFSMLSEATLDAADKRFTSYVNKMK
jgi:hypothetical protein